MPNSEDSPLIIVEEIDELNKVIAELKNNKEKIKTMEIKTKEYYDKFLSPHAVISRIINRH